jgi:hypothetical protein
MKWLPSSSWWSSGGVLVGVALALSASQLACGKLVPKSSGKGGSSGGDAEAAGLTTLYLRPPLLAQFPIDQQAAVTGFELRLTPIDCEAGGTGLAATQRWTGSALQATLASECDYAVLLNLGRLSPDGSMLTEVLYSTTDTLGAPSRIDAGRLDPGVPLTLGVALRPMRGGANVEPAPQPGDGGTLRPPGESSTGTGIGSGTGTMIGTGSMTGTMTSTGTGISTIP